MQRSVVVLPHPLGPRRTTNSRSRISRSNPLTATAPSYDLESPCSLTRAKETLDGEERINNLRLPLVVVASEMTDFHGRDSGRRETVVRLPRDHRRPGVRRDPRPREQAERKARRPRHHPRSPTGAFRDLVRAERPLDLALPHRPDIPEPIRSETSHASSGSLRCRRLQRPRVRPADGPIPADLRESACDRSDQPEEPPRVPRGV